jgi:hypothetical protein
MFLGLPDPYPLVRGVNPDPDPSIILLSSSKNSKKNLDSYSFLTSLEFLSLTNDVNVPSKSISRKIFVFVGLLKVSDENSRIRIRTRIH